jgi:hypothetical protein
MSGSQMIGDPSYTPPTWFKPALNQSWALAPTTWTQQATTPAPQPITNMDDLYRWGTTPRPTATKQQPVVSIEPPKPAAWTIPYNTSDIDAMDQWALRNYTNFLQTKIDMGQWLSEEEMYRARVAQDKIRQQTMAQMSQDTMQPIIDQQRGMITQREQELVKRREAAVWAIDERTRAQQERQFAEAERLAGQRREAQQSALSFSGFGRSTFAAEKQDEINRELNTYMTTAEEIRAANVDLYRLQMEWADNETIAWMYERLQALQTQQAEMNRKMSNDINMYNAEVAATYEEKLENIMQMSQALIQASQPLSEQDMATAASYASLIIDSEWNVNEKILSTVPDKLKPYVVMMWSQIKQETPPPMKFQSVSPWQTLLDQNGNVVFQAPLQWDFSVAGNPLDWFLLVDKNTGQVQTIRWENWVQTSEPVAWEQYTSIPEDTLKSGVVAWSQNFAPWSPWTRNGRCGQFVNDYLKSMWVSQTNLFLDGIIDKKKFRNSSIPKPWAVAIMDSPSFPEQWHVGIVLWADNNWNILVQSSNYNWDGKVTIDAIKPWSIYGYFDPSVQKVSKVNYDPSLSQVYMQVNEDTKKAKELARLAWVDSTTLVRQAEAYKKDQVAQGSIPLLNNIDKLINMLYKKDEQWNLTPILWSRQLRVWSDYTLWRTISPWLADINTIFNNIKKVLWFEYLTQLKAKWATFWALSDWERIAIADAASLLSLDMSDNAFLDELNRIKAELLRVSWWDPRKTTWWQEW